MSVGRPLRFRMPVRGWLRLVLLVWGVTPSRAYVELREGELVARFGFSRFRTELSNIRGHQVTGPYRLWRAIGIRMTPFQWDLTYGTTSRPGLCLMFRQPVRHFFGLRHPALTVTVEDPEALARALEARGIPGGADPAD